MWLVHVDGQSVSLDDFTFGDEWQEIAKRTDLSWTDVYAAPAADPLSAVVVFELACKRLGIPDPEARAKALTAKTILDAFERVASDLPMIAPGGELNPKVGEPATTGSDGAP